MSRGRRRNRHQQAPGHTRVDTLTSEAVVAALSRAQRTSPDKNLRFIVEGQRFAGRSSIYFVRAPNAAFGHDRLVVKRPRGSWQQDDLDSPVSAQQEYLALTRLYALFEGVRGPFRVPQPIALLQDIDAVVMEHVAGPTIRDLLTYKSALRPSQLRDGLSAAGTFLRHVHSLESFPPLQVNLRDEAQDVLAVATAKLEPLGLSLPERVVRILHEIPSSRVASAQVRLHGDFGPGNIILAKRYTVGLDPALQSVGPPESDLVRFVALMSGSIRFAPELLAPPAAGLRRALERDLLRGYYGSPNYPALYELKYLHQLARRWPRQRELVLQNERTSVQPLRLRVVGAQMRRLMEESSHRLMRSCAA